MGDQFSVNYPTRLHATAKAQIERVAFTLALVQCITQVTQWTLAGRGVRGARHTGKEGSLHLEGPITLLNVVKISFDIVISRHLTAGKLHRRRKVPFSEAPATSPANQPGGMNWQQKKQWLRGTHEMRRLLHYRYDLTPWLPRAALDIGQR